MFWHRPVLAIHWWSASSRGRGGQWPAVHLLETVIATWSSGDKSLQGSGVSLSAGVVIHDGSAKRVCGFSSLSVNAHCLKLWGEHRVWPGPAILLLSCLQVSLMLLHAPVLCSDLGNIPPYIHIPLYGNMYTAETWVFVPAGLQDSDTRRELLHHRQTTAGRSRGYETHSHRKAGNNVFTETNLTKMCVLQIALR